MNKRKDSNEYVDLYPFLIKPRHHPLVRRECRWRSNLPNMAPGVNDRITTHHEGYSFAYTHSFTLGFEPSISSVIIESFQYLNVFLGQIGSIVWRAVACLRYLSNLVSSPFTFQHLLHLYFPKLFSTGIFILAVRSKKVVVGPENDHDRGWYIKYVVAPTHELVRD